MIIRKDKLQTEDMNLNPDSWIIAMLVDSEGYHTCCGRRKTGIYTIQIDRKNCDWRMAIGDIISYSYDTENNALLIMTEDEFRQVETFYCGHSCKERSLRMDEPRVLIHSTTLEAWEQILNDGCLKSWNKVKLNCDSDKDEPIGKILGDPQNFRDYIMFGSGVQCELVVASKQNGRIVMDPDEEYQSGARLYFDATKIAEDGLLIRDGAHLKVKDFLQLEPYWLWTATWMNVGIPDRVTTPRIFAEIADRIFMLGE